MGFAAPFILCWALGAAFGEVPVSCAGTADRAIPAAQAQDDSENVRLEREGAAGTLSCWIKGGTRLHVRLMKGSGRVAIVCTFAGGAVLEDEPQRGLTEAAAGGWTRPGPDDDGPPGTPPGGPPPGGPPPGGPGLGERPESGGRGAGPGGRGRAGAGPMRLRAEAAPEGLVLRFSTAPDKLEESLDTIVRMISTPTIDTERLERWRVRMQRWVGQNQSSPERLVAESLMDLLVPDGVPADGQSLRREQIQAIDAPSVERWLKERIVTAPLEVAIAGDFGRDADQVELQAARRLAALPERARIGPGTFSERRRARRPAGPLNQRLELPLPGEAAHLIAGFTGPDIGELDDVRALNVAMEVARRRLETLRLDGKIAASVVGARTMAARVHPGLGAALVMAKLSDEPGGGPAGADGAMQTMQLLLDDLVIAGPTEEEVRSAGAAIADDAERRCDEPEFWASNLSFATLQRIDIAALSSAPETYRGMSAATVRAVLKKWCIGENRFSLVALPRAGEGK